MSRLQEIKNRVLKGQGNLTTSLFYLIKELKCLPDIIGREFEVEYEGDKIKKIRQLPMPIPTLVTLMKELNEHLKREEREMKKNKPRGRR